jgi:hypothetical protein
LRFINASFFHSHPTVGRLEPLSEVKGQHQPVTDHRLALVACGSRDFRCR